MDMMQIRRQMMGVIAQMADGGANYASGTFTTPDSGANYTLNFGKTFSKYVYWIEATDETLTAILNSGATGARSFAFIGTHPVPSANNTEVPYDAFTMRVIPSTGVTNNGSIKPTTTTTSVTFDIGNGTNTLLREMTYRYHVFEIS